MATTTIGSIATLRKGSGLAKSDLVADGAHPCIHYGELFTRYGAVIDVVRSRTGRDLPVKSEVGDVLMPTSDVTPRGLAKASAILSADVGLGGDVLIIRPDRAKADSRFIAYAIRYYVNQVLKLVRGSTVYHLYAADMRHFELPSLPLAEQSRVADALKDSDDLIDSLERLIAKKQAIKQGMMQELLTGRTRLPGFGGAWRTVQLGSVCTLRSGAPKRRTSEGRYWVVDMGSVTRDAHLLVTRRTDERSDPLNAGDLVMPKDDIGGGNIIGRTALIEYSNTYVLADHVYALSVSKVEANASFLNLAINQHEVNQSLRSKASGSAQLGLGKRNVLTQVVRLPGSLEEQQSIAEVLSDCEGELGALKARLNKARAVKQGMMQQLLTGRTRLSVQGITS